ncbi:hypothetical protein ACH5RR_023178 [Cinchona calisaya]|uniref:Reverse transcriptase zinc-binding domain-containing protein n=1 Tax=Cinchona calisaya TaxID=153742 RepID=A0ABD2Z9X2_9GENT
MFAFPDLQQIIEKDERWKGSKSFFKGLTLFVNKNEKGVHMGYNESYYFSRLYSRHGANETISWQGNFDGIGFCLECNWVGSHGDFFLFCPFFWANLSLSIAIYK